MSVLKSVSNFSRMGVASILHPINLKKYSFPGSRTFCSNSKQSRDIVDTSVLVQDGLHIQELPGVVRIIHGEFIVHNGGKTSSGIKFQGLGLEAKADADSANAQSSIVKESDESEIKEVFKKCSSLPELYLLLDTCPQNEINASIALAVMKNIIQLENNKKFRNPNGLYLPEDNDEEFEISDGVRQNPVTFTRSAVMERLVKIICDSANTEVILMAMKALRKDTSKKDKSGYIRHLCDSCLVLISEGKLSPPQIATLAQDLHIIGGKFAKEYCDKLWTGLENGIEDLDEIEVCDLFAMVPYVNKSRSYVFRMAERRALSIWYKFKSDEIIQIVSILVTSNCNSYKLTKAISRWTNVNIHTLSVGSLRWILLAFTKLKFIDDNLENALVRYCKAKKGKIVDSSLMSAIAEYCATVRCRSPEVLETLVQYFIDEHKNLNIGDIWSICSPFGLLNYVPKQSSKFFSALEEVLIAHFSSFPPDLLMDLMLMCVYLERHPLNFTKKIFHPYFFQRIEQLPEIDIKKTYTKLRVLDKALTLEASCYQGPMLIKTKVTASPWMHRDARIPKMVSHFRSAFCDIAGDSRKVHESVIPKDFPISEVYKIDCVLNLSKSQGDNVLLTDCKDAVAILLHVPEHYDKSQTVLNGLQTMRSRHFALNGFKVVNIKYERLQQYYHSLVGAQKFILEEINRVLSSCN